MLFGQNNGLYELLIEILSVYWELMDVEVMCPDKKIKEYLEGGKEGG